MTTIIPTVFDRDKGEKLTVEELAEALYEGSPHLEYLMHVLAKQYGKSETGLPPYHAQNEISRDFWRGIALAIIKHVIEGKYNREAITNGTELS